jgi:hypothetical protein
MQYVDLCGFVNEKKEVLNRLSGELLQTAPLCARVPACARASMYGDYLCMSLCNDTNVYFDMLASPN